ncbi:MAG: ABC transporter permease [Clostridia bacterium]|nr:ABC transporter permease [Clostridia bacterium]
MNNNDMTRLIQSDLFKLKKHKSVWIGMAVMFAIILFQFCIYWIAMLVTDEAGSIVDGEDMQIVITAAYALGRGILAGYSDTAMISLLALIITCIFIGKEFSSGWMRVTVSRGANRIKLYFSKWLSLASLILVYSVFAFLVCGIFTSFRGYGIEFDGHQFGLLMRCFFLQILCNLSAMSIAMMIAFLMRSSGGSLGVCIGLSIGFNLIISIVHGVSMLNGNISPDWITFMPLQQTTVAASLEQLTATQICAVVIMPIVYTAIAMAVGLISFIKRDIK